MLCPEELFLLQHRKWPWCAAKVVLRYVSLTLSSDEATQANSRSSLLQLSVPLGFDLLLSPTSVFILVSFCNLPSFPNMGPWQHTRGLLHLLPKLPSSSPIVIHMYDVQSPRSFYYRGWHLTTLFLDSDQFLMSLTLILLSIDYKLTESAGHSKEVRGWRSGGFYSPSR